MPMKSTLETAVNAYLNMHTGTGISKNWQSEGNTEQDENVIFNQLQFVEKIFPNKGLMLCPLSHTTLKYFSPNCEQILGHPHKSLLKMSIPDILSLIHPEDLAPTEQCLKFVKTLEPYDPEMYRFTIQYRFKSNSANYFPIHNEKLALKTPNNKYLYFDIFSGFPPEEKFYKVTLEINKCSKGKFIKSYTYNPKQGDTVITPRQHEIIKLILKGLSNNEIADHLNVSINTVKNHKQMIFRKVNVNNSMELANYARKSMGNE
jgi:DNA-binding CsgD family transcriptional regulator